MGTGWAWSSGIGVRDVRNTLLNLLLTPTQNPAVAVYRVLFAVFAPPADYGIRIGQAVPISVKNRRDLGWNVQGWLIFANYLYFQLQSHLESIPHPLLNLGYQFQYFRGCSFPSVDNESTVDL